MVKEVVVGLLMAFFLVAAITSGDASKSRSSDNSDAVIEEGKYLLKPYRFEGNEGTKTLSCK